MRLISRNCYRKIAVGIVFSVLIVLIFVQNEDSEKNSSNSTNQQSNKKDKNWEWSQENLHEFMQLLNKHKAPNDSDKSVIHLLNTPYNTSTDDKLLFPHLRKYLPYINDEESALIPSYIVSKRPPDKKASIVFGVPHIKRSKESYLQLTLHFLTKNINPADLNDTLIVVFIAEMDMEYVANTTRMIAHHFNEYINSGLLTVLSPSHSYYPDFDKLYIKQTLGDPLKRVHWRTKQNLDFAYLMMYSYSRGEYYVQLEDDVVSSPDYVGQIKQCINDLKGNKTQWFAVKFCRLGFIGQLIKSDDLPQLISFLLIFHEDQPSDWLLDYLIQVRTCRKDKDIKDCRKRKDSIWRTHKTSLFQHIGYHSSLDGKVQKLKDKFFKTKDFSFFPHKDNPPANVITTLISYKGHIIEKAYVGQDYFWSTDPKKGDNITFIFTNDVLLDSIVINSGNFEHPNDKMPDETTVEILPVIVSNNNSNNTLTSDGFIIIGSFEDGLVKLENLKRFGLIKRLRLTITKDPQFWIILNEIHVKTAEK